MRCRGCELGCQQSRNIPFVRIAVVVEQSRGRKDAVTVMIDGRGRSVIVPAAYVCFVLRRMRGRKS